MDDRTAPIIAKLSVFAALVAGTAGFVSAMTQAQTTEPAASAWLRAMCSDQVTNCS